MKDPCGSEPIPFWDFVCWFYLFLLCSPWLTSCLRMTAEVSRINAKSNRLTLYERNRKGNLMLSKMIDEYNGKSHIPRKQIFKYKTCHRSSFESKVRICNSCKSVFCPCFPAGLNCYGSCSVVLAKGCSICKCCLFPVCTALSAVVKLWVLKRHSWPRAESWSSFFYILQFLTECLLGIFYWSSQFSLWQAQKALTLFCSSALSWIKKSKQIWI